MLIKNNITLHDFTAYSKVIYIHPGYYTLLFSYNFSNYTSSYSGILIKELFLYRPYFILYPLYFALSFSTLILMLTTIYDKKKLSQWAGKPTSFMGGMKAN